MAKIDALLASFNESLSLLRRQCQNSGLGRRFLLQTPTASLPPATARTLSALKDTLQAHSSQLSESNYVNALLLLGSHTQITEARALFQRGQAKFPLSADLHSAMMYAAARVGAVEECTQLFRRAQREGIQITRQMYESAIEAQVTLIEAQQLRGEEASIEFSGVIKWYRRMLQQGHQATLPVLTTLLKAAGRLKDPSAVEELRREQERHRLGIDAQYQETLLFALLQCGQLEAARASYTPSERLFNVMLHGLVRLDAFGAAKTFLSEQHALHGFKPAPGVACLLVECAGRMGFLGEGRRWLDEFVMIVGAGKAVKERAINAMLRAYLRAGDLRSFYELFDKHSNEGGNDETADTDKTDSTDRTNRTTENDNQSSTPSRLALLLRALEINPHPRRLHSTITQLKSQSSDPLSMNALFKLLRLCQASEQLMRSLLGELGVKEKHPSIYLSTIAHFGAFEECEQEWLKLATRTPIDTEALMMSASESSKPSEAVHKTISLLQAQNVWIPPTAHLYAMKGFYSAQAAASVSSQWSLLKSSRLSARVFAAALALQVRSKLLLEGDREGAVALLEAHRRGWDSECLQLHLALNRDSQSPRSLLLILKDSEIGSRLQKLGKPMIGACNEVLTAALQHNESEIVKELLKWMSEQGIFADEMTIQLLVKFDRIGEAETLMQAYQAASRVPTLPCLVPLLRALLFTHCRSLNDQFNGRAERLSQWAVEEVAGGGGFSQGLKEILEIWCEFFKKHRLPHRVTQIEQILKNL